MSDEKNNAYSDTLEIMRNLDLIISTDTSTAHISAALGLKTFLILEYLLLILVVSYFVRKLENKLKYK